MSPCTHLVFSFVPLLFPGSTIVDFFYQHPPAPTFKARVVAATVGGSGIVVLMISNVGLVQVTSQDYCIFIL